MFHSGDSLIFASGINPAAVPCVRYIIEDSYDLNRWRDYSIIDAPSWADPTEFTFDTNGFVRQFVRIRVELK